MKNKSLPTIAALIIFGVLAAYFGGLFDTLSGNWIRAVVKDPTGAPLSGVYVQLDSPDAYAGLSGYTDGAGEFTFKPIGGGNFPVGMIFTGYAHCGGVIQTFSGTTQAPPYIVLKPITCQCAAMYSCGTATTNPPPTTSPSTTSSPTTTTTPTPSSDVRAYAVPTVAVSGNLITGTVYFRNDGGNMGFWNIVEMQVRPEGTAPLVVFSQQTCDPAHPENVNRHFILAAGESNEIPLTSTVGPGVYDIYFLTRDRCWTAANPNNPVAPYPYMYQWGKVTIQGGQTTTTYTTTSPTTTQQGTTTTTNNQCTGTGWRYFYKQCAYSGGICFGEPYYQTLEACQTANADPLSNPVVIAACLTAGVLLLTAFIRR